MKIPVIASALAGLTVAALVGGSSTAFAEMAITNLTKVDTRVVEKQGWSVRKERSRITLACSGCRDFTATDILLERATDGTEGRIRSGKTTAKTMLEICKANAKSRSLDPCYGIKPANIKGAVGFVSDVNLGPLGFAATYVLWQDGRRLTIRNVAPSRRAARQNGRVMFRAIAPQIVR